MQQFYKFITWRFVSLNMFRAPPRPSSGAHNCINSLWFRGWLTTLLPPCSKVKPQSVNAVVSSWWWARRRPKHVGQSKTSSNKLVKLLHLVYLNYGLFSCHVLQHSILILHVINIQNLKFPRNRSWNTKEDVTCIISYFWSLIIVQG